MDTFERLKKIAAGAIILLITLMMGVMFLPGDISDFTGTFVTTSVGSYNGKSIGQTEYGIIYNTCSERVPRMGNDRFREAMIRNCATQTARELFVLPDVGEELGLTVSDVSVQKQVAEEAQQIFQQQQRTSRDADDRLSREEIYLRQLRYAPLSYRKRHATAVRVSLALTRRYPFPREQIRAEQQAKNVTVDLELIRYSNAQLKRSLEDQVTATEDEVRRAYDEEQAKLAADKKKPFDAEQANVRRRLLASKREARVKAVKEELSKLGKDFELDQVTRVTGFRSQRTSTRVDELARAAVGGGRMNLAIPALLTELSADAAGKRIGPVTKDDFTYFIIVRAVRVRPAASDEKQLAAEQRKQGDELARVLLRDMIDQQAERGDFRIKARLDTAR